MVDSTVAFLGSLSAVVSMGAFVFAGITAAEGSAFAVPTWVPLFAMGFILFFAALYCYGEEVKDG